MAEPPEMNQAVLVSVEIFAYIRIVVVLLADPDQHRAIALLRFLGNLIPSTASVHRRLVSSHFIMVDPALLLPAHTAIIFLCKHQRLHNTRCLYALHLSHLLLHLPGQNKHILSER